MLTPGLTAAQLTRKASLNWVRAVKTLLKPKVTSKIQMGLTTAALFLILLMPTKVFAYGETIAVSPSLGLAGQQVTVIGTSWEDHGSRGLTVPIWIGFANEVARGYPDASGKFAVSFTIPPSAPESDLEISAIIGNGGSADTFYKVITVQGVTQPIYWSDTGGQEGGKPQGKASNLIVIVHGCCTTYEGYEGLTLWYKLANNVYNKLVESQPNASWEIVVWDWTKDTPAPPVWDIDNWRLQVNVAYGKAGDQARALAAAIINVANPYTYIHLIGHSAGAKLINDAADVIINPLVNKNIEIINPFIHLTFLDAFTPFDLGVKTYGYLKDYKNRYAEHYVDKGLLFTDAILDNAFNFDITNWPPDSTYQSSSYQKRLWGHQWPYYWYDSTITSLGLYGYPPSFKDNKYGYPLSFEGGNSQHTTLQDLFPRGGQCSIVRVEDNCLAK